MPKNFNPDDFLNEPLFKELRSFADKSEELQNELPSEILMAFRNASAVNVRKVWLRRSIFTFLALGIALPSLSYAQLLPTPIDNVVKKVSNIVTAPIRVVSETLSKVSTSTPPRENLIIVSETSTVIPTPDSKQTVAAVTPQQPLAPGKPPHKVDIHEVPKATPTKPSVTRSEEESEGGESGVPQTGLRPVGGGEREVEDAKGGNAPLLDGATPIKPSESNGGEGRSDSRKSPENHSE